MKLNARSIVNVWNRIYRLCMKANVRNYLQRTTLFLHVETNGHLCEINKTLKLRSTISCKWSKMLNAQCPLPNKWGKNQNINKKRFRTIDASSQDEKKPQSYTKILTNVLAHIVVDGALYIFSSQLVCTRPNHYLVNRHLFFYLVLFVYKGLLAIGNWSMNKQCVLY